MTCYTTLRHTQANGAKLMSDNAGGDEGCQCVWRSRGRPDFGTCGRPVLRNGLCRAHCHDRTPQEDKLFERDVDEKIEDDDCDFRGYVFHNGFRFQKSAAGFEGHRFPTGSDVFFNGAVFRGDAEFGFAEIDGDAWFIGTEIKGEASFDSATIAGDAHFDSATIDGNAGFDTAKIGGQAMFGDATIGASAQFDGATIGGQARFLGSTVDGSACFDAATIRGTAGFVGATIGHGAWFRSAKVNGDVKFSGAKIDGHASFDTATIGGDADFASAHIGRCLSLRGTRIRPGRGLTAYRLAKQTHQRAGDYTAAGDYFFRERCDAWAARNPAYGWVAFDVDTLSRARRSKGWAVSYRLLRSRLRSRGVRQMLRAFARNEPVRRRATTEAEGNLGRILTHIPALAEYIVARRTFGYGEKPLRVVWAAILVVLVCAVCYYFGGGVKNDSGVELASLWDSVYFSLVTFTTVGFGDFRPVALHARLLAGTEAFTGALTMALFAVTLAKRYGSG